MDASAPARSLDWTYRGAASPHTDDPFILRETICRFTLAGRPLPFRSPPPALSMSDASPSTPSHDLVIQILDVGQGDAIYIEFPNGKTMMVDFGSTRQSKGWKVAPTDALKFLKNHTRFKDEGATLDYLIVTHADADHHSLVGRLVSELKPKVKYILFGGAREDYTGGMKTLLDSAGKPGGPVILRPPTQRPFPLWRDTDWRQIMDNAGEEGFSADAMFGGVGVVVLALNVPGTSHPREKGWLRNTPSLVMLLKYARRTVMLTGDATTDTEREIMRVLREQNRLAWLRTDVLKVAHHGSARTSTHPEWVAAVQPSYVFISSDRRGSLDEDTKTSFRLPQELCIDIIRANTTLDQVEQHGYVSSYDPDDYAKYTYPGRGSIGFPLTYTNKSLVGGGMDVDDDEEPTPPPRQWLQEVTTEAIFSTLAYMDAESPEDASEADQGVQYEIRIGSSGRIGIGSTDDGVALKQLAAKTD